jgi:hypothetical protein
MKFCQVMVMAMEDLRRRVTIATAVSPFHPPI